MVEITDTFFARNREEWRKWLSENGSGKREIWLILLKKHVEKECITYEEAVEEAICFGWIDGILKRIDDEKHTIRFSPRRKGSYWSGSNLERVRRMTDQGRMTEAGSRIYEARDPSKEYPTVKYRGDGVDIPEHFAKELKSHPPAWDLFMAMAPSHRNQYIGWIETAKKKETRLRRAKKAVEMIKAGMKGGM
ncbi:MAG: YdeI/OmpD-associated family protein [Thermoplasmatota archaeon]